MSKLNPTHHNQGVNPGVFTVATAPDAAFAGAGTIIYVSNGKQGSPVLAYSNGTNWIRVDDGSTAIAAS